MRTKKLNNKGFTLVEVIVVAVIVAVLALVAIQLYQGYVKEARRNTAENLAASAASHIQSCMNSNPDLTVATDFPDISGDADGQWENDLNPDPDGANIVYFTAPANSWVSVNDAGTGVYAVVGDQQSKDYSFTTTN